MAVGVILSQAVEDAESQLTTAAVACPITGVLWGTITFQMWDEYSLVSCHAVTLLRYLFAYAVIYLPFQTPKLTLPCYLVKFQCFPPGKCLSDHFVLNLRCQRSNGFLVLWRARELTLCECVFNYSLCAGEGGSQKVGEQIWETWHVLLLIRIAVIVHVPCVHWQQEVLMMLHPLHTHKPNLVTRAVATDLSMSCTVGRIYWCGQPNAMKTPSVRLPSTTDSGIPAVMLLTQLKCDRM